MKNNIEQYRKIKKNEHVFTITGSNFRAQPPDQDSDCWGNLWQRTKTKASRFLNECTKYAASYRQ